ncbi:hypothetical protein DSL72_008246 [Monilinia vaccinii-corymbosi]|uniref:Uncharacterized protein n=1 Tax=Monilinia vaccinii-corymbosi TaxID=61207 RepID=A0A8A3PKG0_9HELO|nr:hypothetical protein DSL72_008246 [Monilinia vaccinii-corymbosi]
MRRTSCPRFSIAWLFSDTSASFNHLGSRAADCSITYHGIAEEMAIKQGIAERREYAWRDHWLLVGPKENPAGLPLDGANSLTIYALFSQLFMACDEDSTNIRFLSRYDKSAANIKESFIWTAIGQTPWADPRSRTWLSVEPEIREKMSIVKAGTDDADDPLLNPAHILVGTRGKNITMAHKFADIV